MQDKPALRKAIIISTYLLSAFYLLIALVLFFLLTLMDFKDVLSIEHPIVIFILMATVVMYVLSIGLGSTALVFSVLFFHAANQFVKGSNAPFVLYMVHLALMALTLLGLFRSVVGMLFIGTPTPLPYVLIIWGLSIVCIILSIPSLLVIKHRQEQKKLT